MSNGIDRRGELEKEPFSYRATKDGRIMLFENGKHIKTLAGKEGEKFLQRAEMAETPKALQLLLAKATGNFKRGNERKNSIRGE